MVATNTPLDDELPQEIVDVLEENGVEVTFRTFPSQVVDEINSSVTPGTPVDKTTKGSPFVIKYEKRGPDGKQVEVGRFTIATGIGTSTPVGIIPFIDQTVLDDDLKEWKVDSFEPIKSGNVVVAYDIVVIA